MNSIFSQEFRALGTEIKIFLVIDKEKNIEDAKEIFTIVNNIYFQDIMENQDVGWNKFWKERYNFLKKWLADSE